VEKSRGSARLAREPKNVPGCSIAREEKSMKQFVVFALLLVLIAPAAFAQEEESPEWKATKKEAKRQKIDAMAKEALDTVLEKGPKAKGLFAQAFGYAVFDNLKIAFGLSGGGGVGVAVNKADSARTYMKMGTAGIGLGLGGQKYQVVFLFQDEKTFNSFVDKGWQADDSAKAAAGTAGANVKTGFVNGIAIYQMTDAGLMAQADIAGTKYWKYGKVN
jgi:lipid-binding SYLF domain-containing protein